MTRKVIRFLTVIALVASCTNKPQLSPLEADGIILAFGDSLTAGTGAADSESYPAVLARMINRRVVNSGIPGEFSVAGAARLPEVLEKEHPALLILCHGGNDLLAHNDYGQIAGNLRLMVRTAHERGIAVVLLGVPAPDLTLKPPAFYGDIAKEFSVPLDKKTLPRILGQRTLKSDHIHPNASGYTRLAEAVSTLLRESGALKKQ